MADDSPVPNFIFFRNAFGEPIGFEWLVSVHHAMFQCVHVKDILMNLGIDDIIQSACAIGDDKLSILERLLLHKSAIAPLLTDIFHNDIIATII